MALTKVTGQVIKNTTDVTVGVLTVTNTLAVGGTVSIGGTLTYEDVTNIDSVGLITARDGISVTGGNVTITGGGSFVGDGSQLTGVASTDNIRTNTNATFLQNINVSGTSTIGGDVNIADKIVHIGDTNTAIRFPAADTITAETGGSEKLRISSDGYVGVGENDPANLLHVKVSDTGVSPHASAQIVLERSGTNYLQFLTAADGTSGLLFGDADDNDVGQIKYDHNIPALQFITETTERLRITARGDIAFNRVGMSTAIGNSDSQLSTADPKRFVFNSDYSNGYTDASLKLYLFNHNVTRHGFTSGPSHDLQYHVSGSNPANTNLSISKHTFYKENKKIFQLGYKSGTGENVVGHVGLTTGTSKLAWGNPVSNDYRLGTSGGGALVLGVDGDSEFFAVEGHWTTNRHVEYMRISKEGYMTKPYQPSFLVAAGRAGDGYTDSPYQFRTAVRNVDSAFKMGSGTGQYSYYYVPVTGLYLFTTHAAYQQSGVSFNTRIHRYNSAGAVQEVLELHRNVGFSGSHSGGAGSCMMYCTAGDYVYVAPDFTPYHLNTTLNFFAGCLLG